MVLRVQFEGSVTVGRSFFRHTSWVRSACVQPRNDLDDIRVQQRYFSNATPMLSTAPRHWVISGTNLQTCHGS